MLKEEPKKLAESLDAHFRIFFLGGGAKRGNRIVIKFCRRVGPDIITHANSGDDRFRSF